MSETPPVEAPPSPAVRDRIGLLFGIEAGDKEKIYASIAASASLRDAAYWAELVLSAGIATLGLTLGSPAVIIGAMLISPLMNPIMAAGLALAAGDLLLAVRAAMNIVVSSILAIAFSMLLVTLLPFREMTSEIAARTTPNTLDLGIALLSGLVGALAACKSVRGVATSLPGVAIAVALMPPLCVSGYGIGVILTVDRVQGMTVLRGGSLLFLTNLVAITLASMVVFVLLHINVVQVTADLPRRRSTDRDLAATQEALRRIVPRAAERIGSLPARMFVVLGLVALVFVPLKRSFDALTSEIRQRQQLNAIQRAAQGTWEELFGRSGKGGPRSYVDRFDAVESDGTLRLTVRAFTSAPITPSERATFLVALARELRRPRSTIDLAVVEIPTSQYQVARAVEPAAPPPPPLGRRIDQLSADVESAVAATLLPPGVTLVDSAITLGSRPELAVNYLSRTALSDDAAAMIAEDLRRRLDVDAVVRLQHIPEYVVPTPESLQAALSLLLQHEQLRVVVRSVPQSAERAIEVTQQLVAGGLEPARVRGESLAEAPDPVAIVIHRPDAVVSPAAGAALTPQAATARRSP